MADFDDAGKGKNTVSRLTAQEILQNLGDIVDKENNHAPALLEVINMIQMDNRMTGLLPMPPVCVRNAGGAAVANHPLIFCPGGKRIVIFDIFVSLTAACTISWSGQDVPQLMSDMIAPNPGQGFTRTSSKGIFLPKEKSLFYSCSAAVAHSLDVSYALLSE